jgi:hypothetical protein
VGDVGARARSTALIYHPDSGTAIAVIPVIRKNLLNDRLTKRAANRCRFHPQRAGCQGRDLLRNSKGRNCGTEIFSAAIQNGSAHARGPATRHLENPAVYVEALQEIW